MAGLNFENEVRLGVFPQTKEASFGLKRANENEADRERTYMTTADGRTDDDGEGNADSKGPADLEEGSKHRHTDFCCYWIRSGECELFKSV